MIPRISRNYDLQIATRVDSPAEQIFYFQRGTGYTHNTEKTASCEGCYQSLPRIEKIHWLKIFKHTLTIGGTPIGINCERCGTRLTVTRLGFNCTECIGKYELYLINPELVDIRDDDNHSITVNVYTYIQVIETGVGLNF